MREGWEIKKLGEVCEVLNGFAFDSKLFTQNSNDMPLIRIRDIMRSYSETFYSGVYSDSYIIRKGDFLIGMDGEFNIAEWKGEPSLLNQRVCKVSSANSNLNDRFLLWLLPKKLKDIESKTAFVTVKHLSSRKLLDLCIPVPPLSEQTRIVSELDLLNDIIDKKRQQLKELDALSQSIFYDMFGDPVTNEKGWECDILQNLTVKIGSGATPRGGDQSYKDSGISLIRSLNVYNNIFTDKNLVYIDDEQAGKLKNVIVNEGDILLNITGASVARSCIVPSELLPARVNQHVAIIRPKLDLLEVRFLSYLITSPTYQMFLLHLSRSNGATREALTKGQLEMLNVILPPLALQQQFASRITAIEQQKQLIQASLSETETLLQSRMDYYFN